MTAPSNANTSGLEVVAWTSEEYLADTRLRKHGAYWMWGNPASSASVALVTAASAQARIAELEALVESYRKTADLEARDGDAAEARADRLAKDTTGLLAEIASFGRAFMAAQESLASTSTPDAYDDAILAASVRYQSMVKTASALFRAALQQETQK